MGYAFSPFSGSAQGSRQAQGNEAWVSHVQGRHPSGCPEGLGLQ